MVNFIRKSSSKSFNNGLKYKRVDFQCICETLPTQYTQLPVKFWPEQLNLERQWEVANSEISYISMFQIVTEEKFMFYDTKLSNSSEYYRLEPGLYRSIIDIVETMKTLIEENHNYTKTFVAVKVSRRAKKLNFTSQL